MPASYGVVAPGPEAPVHSIFVRRLSGVGKVRQGWAENRKSRVRCLVLVCSALSVLIAFSVLVATWALIARRVGQSDQLNIPLHPMRVDAWQPAVYGVHSSVDTTPFDELIDCTNRIRQHVHTGVHSELNLEEIPSECKDDMRTATLRSTSSLNEHTLYLGPIVTLPEQWVSAYIPQRIYDTQLASIDRVIEFTGDGVDEDGAVLPFPPLHVHHIHVSRGSFDSDDREQLEQHCMPCVRLKPSSQ